jgi:hypothetical protein
VSPVLELIGDGGAELAQIELAKQPPRDLTEDRELGDAQGLLELLAASLLLEPAGLGG